MFGRLKALRSKIEGERNKQRERKIAAKSERLGIELKKAREREAIANKEAKIRKLDADIRRTKNSNPSKGKQLLNKLGKAAVKVGKNVKNNQQNIYGRIDWIGNSPLTRTTNNNPLTTTSKPSSTTPRKKRVRIIEYE